MNYMTLESATQYLLQIGADVKIDLKDVKDIDGTLYVYTTAIKSAIGAADFRLMECKVATHYITYNDIILMGLKRKAAAQMENYQQYAYHEQKYVLGKAVRECKTKMGLVFYENEYILIEPRENIREFKDLSGKDRSMIFVWSMNNRCATSVDVEDVEWVDNTLPF
jgi:hypothetical protein